MPTLINGGNYFNEISFNDICEALERGDKVRIYIDCIGHLRNSIEQEAYRETLIQKYGSDLNIELSCGGYSYNYSYSLL